MDVWRHDCSYGRYKEVIICIVVITRRLTASAESELFLKNEWETTKQKAINDIIM